MGSFESMMLTALLCGAYANRASSLETRLNCSFVVVSGRVLPHWLLRELAGPCLAGAQRHGTFFLRSRKTFMKCDLVFEVQLTSVKMSSCVNGGI